MKNKEAIAELLAATINSIEGVEPRSAEQILELIELPKDRALGDWAFPCFQLAKSLRKAPPQIAADLASRAEGVINTYAGLSSVRAVGPYLNFFVNKSALAAGLIPQILDGRFLAPRPKLVVRMMVEYSQPNTHKAFHVGHIRCAALGDTLIRIFEWTGTEVVASNYLGDEGTHVAKCLWYYTEIYKGETPATNRGEFLGTLYTAANDLVDLSTLTRAPFPGVVAARVLTVSAHPEEKDWLVATVDTGVEKRTVVTATRGFAAGDVVPIALPGTKVADRAIGVAKRGSVVSEGMLCNAAELSLSEDTATIYQLPKDTALGTEVAELFRIPGALPADRSVIAEWRTRSEAVSKVLQKLEAGDPKLKEIWAKTKDWSMQEFYAIYSWLDCRFDHYFFESELAEPGKELVREYQSRGIFKEDQGAIGVDLSEFGLGFCIVLKRDGTANYATRDLALARRKFEEYKIDRSLYIVDIAQTHHFQQVFKVLELMGFPQAKQCHHLAYAQVVRPDGKMSSRKGNVILFSELQERLLSKIQVEFLDKYRGDWSEEEIATAAHRLALATMRYGMLSPDTSSAVIFDLDDWTSRTGNTGPYLMYACARIYSVLREIGEVTPTGVSWELLAHDSEVNLILHLNRYQEVILHAADSYSPHNLAAYLYELSKKFSTMYGYCSVMNAETAELRQARACLIKSVVLVLEHGLGLLGIKTVQRM
jgi:arginyl-tRNA synthetase